MSGILATVLRQFATDNQHLWRTLRSSGGPNAACWRAWAASADLDFRGGRQPARAWINIAANLLDDDECRDERVLRAEVIGLAARLLYEEGDVGDALPSLVDAGYNWQAIAEAARDPDALEGLAEEIRRMMAAFDPDKEIIPEKGLAQSHWLVDNWEEDCLIESWSKLAATEGRALGIAGRYDAARQAIHGMKTWMRRGYYVPADPTIRANYFQVIEHAVAEGIEESKFILPFITMWLEDLHRPATKEQTLAHLRKKVEEHTKEFESMHVLPSASLPLWRLAMAEGDIELAAGAWEASAQAFEFAVRVWDGNVINYGDLHCVAKALFNQGNSYLRLERYADARDNYAKCLEYFGTTDPESSTRVRHADLVTKWKLDPDADIETEGRRLLVEWEESLREKPDHRFLYIDKVAVSPLYEMMASVLARRGERQAALDYFDILAALREGQALTGIIHPPNGDDTDGVRKLQVLSELLSERPGYLAFFLQRGIGELTYLALRGGVDVMEDPDSALLLGVMPAQLLKTVDDLLQAQQEELKAIYTGQSLETGMASQQLTRLCAQAWQALPDRLRDWLLGAPTIVFSPDASGNYDEVPLELFHTEHGWLGIDHTIVRHPSAGSVMSLLSCTRPGQLANRAYVIRGEDPPGFLPLPDADVEVTQVTRCLRLLGLEALSEVQPDVAALIEALDAGYRVVHYSGHGLAGDLSEGLPLAVGQTLQPRDLGALSGRHTPFVFLSSCEVGRTRYVGGGKQSGLAIGLVEKGAPAVVGCLHAVPDRVSRLMATAFYRSAKTHPVGEALCLARKRLSDEGTNPACWGLFALYGDPAATICHEAISGR